MLDKDDGILQTNKNFEIIFQYIIDEIRCKFLNEVIVPESMLDEVNNLSNDTFQKITVNKETLRKRKDETLVPVQILV